MSAQSIKTSSFQSGALSRTRLAIVALATLGFAGCQSSYRKTVDELAKNVAVGNYDKAANEASDAAERAKDDEIDRVAYLLEAGRCRQLAGDIEGSTEWYLMASDTVRPYYDELAEAKVTEGAATTIVNQTVSEYRGTNPERIMLETMLAVNALVGGDWDSARISINRAYDWQRYAVLANSREISEATDAAEKEASKSGITVSEDNAGLVLGQEQFRNLGSMKAYADYADPFSTYLNGVFRMLTRNSGSQDEDAVFSLKRVVSLHGLDETMARYIEGDLALSAQAAPQPHTWVFLLEGLAPFRKEFRLDIPIPIGDVNYVSAAFPYLEDRPEVAQNPTVVLEGGVRMDMLLLSDVGRMVKADFAQKLSAIVFQEILSAALKAGATYAAKEAGGVWAQAGGMIYQAASTAADLRSWRTLPNRVFVARIPTPTDSSIQVMDWDTLLFESEVPSGSSGLLFVTKPALEAEASVQYAVLVEPMPATNENAL